MASLAIAGQCSLAAALGHLGAVAVGEFVGIAFAAGKRERYGQTCHETK
jgi:hypothetical protein